MIGESMKKAIIAALAATALLSMSNVLLAKQSAVNCGGNESTCAFDMGEKLNIDRVDAAIKRHQSSALAILPAKRGTVADVFRQRHLQIAENGEAWCGRIPFGQSDLRAGCVIEVYVSRKRASGRYSALAGVHAIWFKSIHDNSFVPVNDWAQHVSDNDEWLRPGGWLDSADRP
jgi:hypothetical protein